MPERAREIHQQLRQVVPAEFDEGGSIGKRYRRQDEIGTPYCLTIDGQTMEDGTVTLRDRDTLEQRRISADEVVSEIERRLDEPWSPPARS
jgi:glycyl-tRNA synthetase